MDHHYCIIYEDNEPTHIFNNLIHGQEYMHQICNHPSKTHINVKMVHMTTFMNTSICTTSETYIYDNTNHVVIKDNVKGAIYTQQTKKYVNKIMPAENEKITEISYETRCIEQKKRIDDEKYKEKISILKSDKNTYVKLRSKIDNNTLCETNISQLFKYKYYILKCLFNDKLINFSDDTNIENELHAYSEMYKIINIMNINDEDEKTKLMDALDNKYIDSYIAFIDILDQNTINNESVNIFCTNIDTTIFDTHAC